MRSTIDISPFVGTGKHINLSNLGLSDERISEVIEIIDLNKIESLDISSNNLTDKSIPMLCLCNSLIKLNVAYNNLTDNCISAFKKENLVELNLSQTEITNEGANLLVKIAPKLRGVNLSNTNVSKENACEIQKKLDLRISSCNLIKNNFLTKKQNQDLTTNKIDSSSKITPSIKNL